jgi:DeoR/GlpR family transcriptional regulator of sugar metabolism
MTTEERRSRILKLAQAHGTVRVAQLVDDFQVSTMTIRRDLSALDAQGLIRRVHGGAMRVDTARSGTPPRVADDQDPLGRRVSVAADSAPGELSACHMGIVVPDAE